MVTSSNNFEESFVELEDNDDDISQFSDSSDLAEEETLKNEFHSVSVQRNRMEVAVDTEYTSQDSVSIQARVRGELNNKYLDFTFLVINEKYKSSVERQLINNSAVDYIYYGDFSDSSNNLICFFLLQTLAIELGSVDEIPNNYIIYFYFYFSIKDLTISFGLDNVLFYYIGNAKNKKKNKINNTNLREQFKIVQRRSITGKLKFEVFYQKREFEFIVVLRDLFGLDSFGLESLIASSGLSDLNLQYKSLMDPYKEKIDDGLLAEPETFVKYSMNDAIVLLDIADRKVENFNSILIDVYKISDANLYFNRYTIPLTLGSLVASLWSKYLDFVVFKNNDVYKLASLKLAILNGACPGFKTNKVYFEQLLKFNSLQEISEFKENNPIKFAEIKSALFSLDAFKYRSYQYCSIKYLLDISGGNNTYLLAMTSGGRTVNERPEEFLIEYGADIDIASAYGTQLTYSFFPVGRPRIYTTTPNQLSQLTLGEFMDKNLPFFKKKKLFKVLVSGELSFEQDFLHSKILSETSAKNKIKDFSSLETGQQALQTQFLLLKKELINSSITYSSWDILTKICSNKEMKEIRNLKVVSAIYYFDKDFAVTIEDFLDSILRDKGEYQYNFELQTTFDSRTHKAFCFPLSDFISPLVERRGLLKKEKNNPSSQALSFSLKYVINTLWGILTSVFFDLNNVICSEIVTNSIRNSVWLTSKAFNTVLSITDGGPYSLTNINSFRPDFNKKPGLNSFSSYSNICKHPSLVQISLGNKNWKQIFSKNENPIISSDFLDLDLLANNHLIDFWKAYAIQINFKLEHKIERCFLKCSYIQKAHYAMLIYSPATSQFTEELVVIRGLEKKREKLKYVNPVYFILTQMLYNNSPEKDLVVLKNNGIYEHRVVVKLSTWRDSLQFTKTKVKSSLGKNVMPGDFLIVYRK